MYTLSFDPEQSLLVMETKGFWTMDIFRAYEAELHDLLARIGKTHERYRTLSNSLKFDIQSSQVSAAFDALVNSSIIRANRGPIAIVTNGILKKMQAERGMRHLNVRFFDTVDEATVWLFEVE